MTKNKIKLGNLAKEVGFPKSTIHGWINGIQPRSILELNKVAKYFGLNIHQLCFGEEDLEEKNKSEQVIAKFNGVKLVLRKI